MCRPRTAAARKNTHIQSECIKQTNNRWHISDTYCNSQLTPNLPSAPPPPAHTGQVPDDSAKGKDIVTQTENVLAQIDALLARAGSDKTKILSAQVTVQLVF